VTDSGRLPDIAKAWTEWGKSCTSSQHSVG